MRPHAEAGNSLLCAAAPKAEKKTDGPSESVVFNLNSSVSIMKIILLGQFFCRIDMFLNKIFFLTEDIPYSIMAISDQGS